MSQYDTGTFHVPSQYGDSMDDAPRTSVLAICSLVFALLICLPLGWLGVILGIVALIGMVGKAHIRGRGLAIAGIVIGLISTAIWVVSAWGFLTVMLPMVRFVMEAPNTAMNAAAANDVVAFKAAFQGDGATAPDDVAQAFIDEVRSRYGAFTGAEVDQSAQPPTSPTNQPVVAMPYVLHFSGTANVPADVELVLMDTAGSFVLKLGWIEIRDSVQGDLRYPPLPPTPIGPSGTPLPGRDGNGADGSSGVPGGGASGAGGSGAGGGSDGASGES